MIRRVLAAAIIAILAAPLYAGFSEVANAMEKKRGIKRVWIPFLSVARAVVWMARPAGVHDFQLATFEATDDVDPRDMAALMRERAGDEYQPLVRVHSVKNGEWSFIYAKPPRDGDRVDLLILAHDDENTVLVRVDVDADMLVRAMDDPKSVTHIADP